MSRPTTNPIPSHIRAPSLLPTTTTSTNTHPSHLQPPSSYLQSRIASKRTELDDLRQLRDLSADLAGQMAVLQEKLGVLSGGTEAVALVLSNWGNVLRAIQMAALKIPRPDGDGGGGGDGEEEQEEKEEGTVPLPTTLVRIPVGGEDSHVEGSGPGEGNEGGG